MRITTSDICLDERTNERGGRTDRKHNVFADIVGWRWHDKSRLTEQICCESVVVESSPEGKPGSQWRKGLAVYKYVSEERNSEG